MDRLTTTGGLFAGALDRASQTLEGRFSTVIDEFRFAGATLAEGLLPVVHDVTDGLINLGQALQGLSPDQIRGITLAAGGLVGLVGLGTGIAATVRTVQTLTTAARALVPVLASVNAALGPIGIALTAVTAAGVGLGIALDQTRRRTQEFVDAAEQPIELGGSVSELEAQLAEVSAAFDRAQADLAEARPGSRFAALLTPVVEGYRRQMTEVSAALVQARNDAGDFWAEASNDQGATAELTTAAVAATEVETATAAATEEWRTFRNELQAGVDLDATNLERSLAVGLITPLEAAQGQVRLLEGQLRELIEFRATDGDSFFNPDGTPGRTITELLGRLEAARAQVAQLGEEGAKAGERTADGIREWDSTAQAAYDRIQDAQRRLGDQGARGRPFDVTPIREWDNSAQAAYDRLQDAQRRLGEQGARGRPFDVEPIRTWDNSAQAAYDRIQDAQRRLGEQGARGRPFDVEPIRRWDDSAQAAYDRIQDAQRRLGEQGARGQTFDTEPIRQWSNTAQDAYDRLQDARRRLGEQGARGQIFDTAPIREWDNSAQAAYDRLQDAQRRLSEQGTRGQVFDTEPIREWDRSAQAAYDRLQDAQRRLGEQGARGQVFGTPRPSGNGTTRRKPRSTGCKMLDAALVSRALAVRSSM